MIQQQIDQILDWAAGALGDDIVLAKRDYFASTGGEVHEDDRSFEARMQGFFNWYLFDRPTPGAGSPQTPAQRFLQERGAELSGRDKDLIIGATQSRLSLYAFRGRRSLLRRVPHGMVRVRDAFDGEDYDVLEKGHMHGLEAGDLFEARVFPVAGKNLFSTSFTFHPREVRRIIQRELKRRRKAQQAMEPTSFCWELSRMALQSERFRNVSILAIYNFEKPFLANKRPRSNEGMEQSG